jgi:dihydroxyacetone kinase-like predicted kinase
MNPSVYDILNAVNSVNAKNVIVFPNNKNIILAAMQAKDMAEKNVVVIPTENSPQGISAALAFMPESSIESNTEAMTESIKKIKCGQVTHAVRNTRMNGFSVKTGDIIGLNDKNIIAKGDDVGSVVESVVEA